MYGKPGLNEVFYTQSAMRYWLLAVLVLLPVFCVVTDVSRTCDHGTLLSNGTCACESCWTGESCSQYASRPPKFVKSFDTATLTLPDGDDPKTIYKAEAQDPDQEFCPDLTKCPCSSMRYFIVSQDEDSGFSIDQSTGDVSVSEDSHSLYSEYQLTLGVTDDSDTYDTMTLIVNNEMGDSPSSNRYRMGMDEDESETGYSVPQIPLSRHKRATLPTTVTFSLSKYGANVNTTVIKVGVRIQFKLDVTFPSGTTDMQIELFAPDSENVIMMLCNVVVTLGSNLKVTGRTTADMDSLDKSIYNDWATIKLGMVTNSGSDTSTLVPSTLTVTYEAVMIQNTKTVNGQNYYVSAGAEYNSENDVWVGQASFTANTDDDSASFTEKPVVNITGPATLPIGSCGSYVINMALNRPSVDLKFNFQAPADKPDIMCLCTAKVLSVNNAYQCGMKPKLSDYVPALTADGNSLGYRLVTFDLGRPVNKFAREYATTPSSSYQGIISFGVQLCMNNDPSLVSKVYKVGSSIQIGTTSIWAGNIDITAANKAASQSVTPNFYMTFPDGQFISRTNPVSILLNMEVPDNSSAEYSMEVYAPFKQMESIFQVCSVQIVSAGDNLACLLQRKLNVQYSMTSNTSIYPDVAKVNLGPINNLGYLVTPASGVNKLDNTVTFKILFKVTKHPSATVNSVHSINFGMFVGDQKLVIGTTNLTVKADAAAVNVADNNMPVPVLNLMTDSTGKLPIGVTGLLTFDLKTARNVSYNQFNVEFIMPNASLEPLIRICKVKLQFVGANNPCVVAAGIERSVQMISTYNPLYTDRAVIDMDTVCNMQQIDKESEDHIVLSAGIVLMNNAYFKTTPTTQIDAGIMFNNQAVKIVRLSVQANVAYTPASLSAAPYLGVVSNNGNLISIPWGAPISHFVRIKMSPNDTTPLSMFVTTLDNALSVCGVRLVRAGDAYLCMQSPTGTLIYPDAKFGTNKGGTIDLAGTTNTGSDLLSRTDTFDSNTIELEVITKMILDSTVAPDGSTHALKFVLNYNPNYSTQVSATVTVTTTSDSSLFNKLLVAGTNVTGSMAVYSATGSVGAWGTEKLNVIVPSESKRIVLSVETLPNTTSNISVTMTTPNNIPNVMEILYIGLLSAGENLGCVKAGQSKTTYEPRQPGGVYTDIATLALGYVCNTGLITNKTGSNTIQVESIFRLLSPTTVSSGTVLQIQGAIIINNNQMMVDGLPLTVDLLDNFVDIYNNNTNPAAQIVYNSSDTNIALSISQLKIFPIVIIVPPLTSSRVRVDVVTPVRTSAVMTVNDVKIVRTGRNLPKLELYQDKFDITKTSAQKTSQITKYEIEMGVVTNPGISYRDGRNMSSSDDDAISMEVTIQMADDTVAVDKSIFNISFGVRVVNVVYILDVNVAVQRTGSESIVYNFSSILDQSTSTTTSVDLETSISLSSTSTAEGQTTILNLFLPSYVKHLNSYISSPDKDIISTTDQGNVVTLLIGPLFFTDFIQLRTLLAANTSATVPVGITGQNSICAMQLVANTNTEQNIPSDFIYVNFSIATTTKNTADCAIKVLGMEAKTIQDCQISSSADSVSGVDSAVQGRYNTGSGWSPFVHTGTAKEERYFQIFFGQNIMVTRFKLQQSGQSFATKLNVRYSNDGLAWFPNFNQMSPVLNMPDQDIDIPSPQASRYLRVMITALDDETLPALFKFEFYGCVIGNDVATDVCAGVKPPTKLPDFDTRTFINVGSTLFVSVGIKGSKGIVQKSYTTTDDMTWKEVPAVGCILGYESSKSRWYAISTNGNSYLTSPDGDQWYSVSQKELNAAEVLPTYKHSKQINVDGDPELDTQIPNTVYIDNIYGATVDGIMVNRGSWRTILTWKQ